MAGDYRLIRHAGTRRAAALSYRRAVIQYRSPDLVIRSLFERRVPVKTYPEFDHTGVKRKVDRDLLAPLRKPGLTYNIVISICVSCERQIEDTGEPISTVTRNINVKRR